MRRLVLIVVVAATLAPVGPAAAVPTIRLAILHYWNGCHVWSSNNKPNTRIVVRRGTRVAIRPNCPMDFDIRQVAGPKLAFGSERVYAGTTRTVLFRRRGIYRLVVKNVQSSEEQGLETLGPDNRLTLTVVVK
jgi:hypothetical protein